MPTRSGRRPVSAGAPSGRRAAAPADRGPPGTALTQRRLNALLEVDDQPFAFRQQPAMLDQAGGDSALDVFDQHLVLGADLVVELEQLRDPAGFNLETEEVVEESLRPLRPCRQNRADGEVRLSREDVDHRVRPEKMELAAGDLAVGVEAAAVLADRAELTGEGTAGRELVRIRRDVDERAEPRMRHGAVVALQEILGDELPIRVDGRFGAPVKLEPVDVDPRCRYELRQLPQSLGERDGVRIGV